MRCFALDQELAQLVTERDLQIVYHIVGETTRNLGMLQSQLMSALWGTYLLISENRIHVCSSTLVLIISYLNFWGSLTRYECAWFELIRLARLTSLILHSEKRLRSVGPSELVVGFLQQPQLIVRSSQINLDEGQNILIGELIIPEIILEALEQVDALNGVSLVPQLLSLLENLPNIDGLVGDLLGLAEGEWGCGQLWNGADIVPLLVMVPLPDRSH